MLEMERDLILPRAGTDNRYPWAIAASVLSVAVVALAGATFAGSKDTAAYAVAPAAQVASRPMTVPVPRSSEPFSLNAHSARATAEPAFSTSEPSAPVYSEQTASSSFAVGGAFLTGALLTAAGLFLKARNVKPAHLAPMHMCAEAGYMGEMAPENMTFPWWDDPGFQQYVLKNFPEQGIADPEEARVLWTFDDYDILDVRGQYEREDRGSIKLERGSVHIPLHLVEYKYSPEAGKKVIQHEVNPEWLNQVKARFPDKQKAKILVMCSDGRDRAIQALELLDMAGYVNLVGMKGGFNKWDATFDNRLRRRDVGVATEVYNHVDSEGNTIAGCGIHASGVGFEMMDSLKYDLPSLRDTTEWKDWAKEMGVQME